jgi:hypothetical protein
MSYIPPRPSATPAPGGGRIVQRDFGSPYRTAIRYFAEDLQEAAGEYPATFAFLSVIVLAAAVVLVYALAFDVSRPEWTRVPQ